MNLPHPSPTKENLPTHAHTLTVSSQVIRAFNPSVIKADQAEGKWILSLTSSLLLNKFHSWKWGRDFSSQWSLQRILVLRSYAHRLTSRVVNGLPTLCWLTDLKGNGQGENRNSKAVPPSGKLCHFISWATWKILCLHASYEPWNWEWMKPYHSQLIFPSYALPLTEMYSTAEQ